MNTEIITLICSECKGKSFEALLIVADLLVLRCMSCGSNLMLPINMKKWKDNVGCIQEMKTNYAG